MGVQGLWQLLEPVGRPVTLESMENKVLAVDTSVWLHQLSKGFADGTESASVNPQLQGLFHRICKLLFYKVKPIFVFDGGVPELKKKTMAARKQRKLEASVSMGKTSQKILENFIKSKALASVTGRDSNVTPARGKSAVERDLYELPPPPVKLQVSSSESSDDECETSLLDQFRQQQMLDPANASSAVDVQSNAFRCLPLEVQHELIKDLREENKHVARYSSETLPQEADDFSSFQIGNLLKRSRLGQRLEEVRKELNTRSVGEVMPGRTVGDNVAVERIVSQDQAHYILIRNPRKGQQGDWQRTKQTDPNTEKESFKITEDDEIIKGYDSETVKQKIERLLKERNLLKDAEGPSSSKHVEPDKMTEDSENSESSSLSKKNDIEISSDKTVVLVEDNAEKERNSESSYHSKGNRISADKTVVLVEQDSERELNSESSCMGKKNIIGKSVEESVVLVDDDSEKNFESSCLNNKTSNRSSTNQSPMFVGENSEKEKSLGSSYFAMTTSNRISTSENALLVKDVDSVESCSGTTGEGSTMVSKGLVEIDPVFCSLTSKDWTVNDEGDHGTGVPFEHEGDPSTSNEGVPSREGVLDPEPSDSLSLEEQINSKKRFLEELIQKRNAAQGKRKAVQDDLSVKRIKTVEDVEVTKDEEMGDINMQRALLESLAVETKHGTDSHQRHSPVAARGEPVLTKRMTVSSSESSDEEDFIEVQDTVHTVLVPEEDNVRFQSSSPEPMPENVEFTEVPVSEKPSEDLVSAAANEEESAKEVEEEEKEEEEEEKVSMDDDDDDIQVMKHNREDDIPDDSQRGNSEEYEQKQAFSDFDKFRVTTSSEGGATSPSHQASLRIEEETPEGGGEAHESDVITPSIPDEWQRASLEQLATFQDQLDSEQMLLQSERSRQSRIAADVTNELYKETQELLRLFGVPYMVCPMEAEAQCASLDLSGVTQGSITDDSDIFLFGGRRVYRNIFRQHKHAELYVADDINRIVGLDREKLIKLALLSGSDYTTGIKGIGVVTAMEILNEFEGEGLDGLKIFQEWHRRVQSASVLHEEGTKLKNKLRHVKLGEGFPSEQVYWAYIKPTVDESDEEFHWGSPDLHSLRIYTSDKFGWTREKTDETLLPVLKKLNERQAQSTLDRFLKIHLSPVKKTFSKRVQRAVRSMRNRTQEITADEPEASSAGSHDTSQKGGRRRAPRGRSRDSSRDGVLGCEGNRTSGVAEEKNSKYFSVSKRGKVKRASVVQPRSRSHASKGSGVSSEYFSAGEGGFTRSNFAQNYDEQNPKYNTTSVTSSTQLEESTSRDDDDDSSAEAHGNADDRSSEYSTSSDSDEEAPGAPVLKLSRPPRGRGRGRGTKRKR